MNHDTGLEEDFAVKLAEEVPCISREDAEKLI